MSNPDTQEHHHYHDPHVTLRLQFDVNQESDGLHLSVVRKNRDKDPAPDPDPYPQDGPYADTLYFEKDEKIHVEVVATAVAPSKFKTFHVVECVILTRPGIVERDREGTTAYATPSMFQPTGGNLQTAGGACYLMKCDFSEPKDASGNKMQMLVESWKHSLHTVDQCGNWRVSVALTVSIQRNDDTEPELRVYWRDPESEVGGRGSPTDGGD